MCEIKRSITYRNAEIDKSAALLLRTVCLRIVSVVRRLFLMFFSKHFRYLVHNTGNHLDDSVDSVTGRR